MNVVNLYKINRVSGSVKITPNAPSEDAVPTQVRIIAGEGKVITKDGVTLYHCKDENIITGEGSIEDRIEATCEPWYEVDMPEEVDDEDNSI